MEITKEEINEIVDTAEIAVRNLIEANGGPTTPILKIHKARLLLVRAVLTLLPIEQKKSPHSCLQRGPVLRRLTCPNYRFMTSSFPAIGIQKKSQWAEKDDKQKVLRPKGSTGEYSQVVSPCQEKKMRRWPIQ